MESSPYDFDVVTGPSTPRQEGKEKPSTGDAEKPEDSQPAVPPPPK